MHAKLKTRMKNNINIIEPSKEEVKFYLNEWDSLENYTLQESSLRKLFTKTYPLNKDLDDVLIKVCALNDFYSTNILSPFTVAKYIVSLQIDNCLEEGDLNIVEKITGVTMNGGKVIHFYSFATKYCSHHKPTAYPIYDSYVDKMLMYCKKTYNFALFKKEDLKSYAKFKDILLRFRTFYKLEEFDLKQIDKYLWQAGRKYFPRKYKKNKEG